MVADFTIDRPSLLEINHKIATMGGGDYHLGEKRDSIFSLCQKIGLSLFGVCLFFGGFWCIKKLGLPPKKNYWREDFGWTP
jgi:hypothetical protein